MNLRYLLLSDVCVILYAASQSKVLHARGQRFQAEGASELQGRSSGEPPARLLEMSLQCH